MRKETIIIGGDEIAYVYGCSFRDMLKQENASSVLIITDVNVAQAQQISALPYRHFIMEPGEGNKVQSTVTAIIDEMLAAGYQRNTLVVGLGGGVVTDVAGFVASIFKRGVRLLQAPSSLLGMVDAAIGGKNGINAGAYKNMVGTIYQPETIVFDYSLLETLPDEEWVNGFAEIIKHTAIQDAEMLKELEANDIAYYRANPDALQNLVERNVAIKNKIVARDMTENGDRRLLNFGHTFGHAIEKVYGLPHGQAVGVGMMMAAKISEEVNNFYSVEVNRLRILLDKYGLMTSYPYQKAAVWRAVAGDKKLDGNNMQFVVLDKPGVGNVMQIPMGQLFSLLEQVL